MEGLSRGARRRGAAVTTVVAAVLSGCGGAGATTGPAPAAPAARLLLAPQNTEFLVGVQRVSFALFDARQRPLAGAKASLELRTGGTTFETRTLQDIGPEYGHIPIYVGFARFPATGPVTMLVRARLPDGRDYAGQTVGVVTDKSVEIPVGHAVPALRQPVTGDPGVSIAQLDSGVPPDPWHRETVAEGLSGHRPMVLYFGQPGFCRSQTCGPTVQVLQGLCKKYCGQFLFEHIEVHFPAGPDETGRINPAFAAFGLQTEPWVYFINADGVVAARFEGPVTVAELRSAAAGTLGGRVPAVEVTVN